MHSWAVVWACVCGWLGGCGCGCGVGVVAGCWKAYSPWASWTRELLLRQRQAGSGSGYVGEDGRKENGLDVENGVFWTASSAQKFEFLKCSLCSQWLVQLIGSKKKANFFSPSGLYTCTLSLAKADTRHVPCDACGIRATSSLRPNTLVA
jgi:hypothetical protein